MEKTSIRSTEYTLKTSERPPLRRAVWINPPCHLLTNKKQQFLLVRRGTEYSAVTSSFLRPRLALSLTEYVLSCLCLVFLLSSSSSTGDDEGEGIVGPWQEAVARRKRPRPRCRSIHAPYSVETARRGVMAPAQGCGSPIWSLHYGDSNLVDYARRTETCTFISNGRVRRMYRVVLSRVCKSLSLSETDYVFDRHTP